MTHPMFVEKTCRLKFVRQNFIKAEKFARQNSYFQALGVYHPPPPSRSYAPGSVQHYCPQEVTFYIYFSQWNYSKQQPIRLINGV